jgi:hypothetical protein
MKINRFVILFLALALLFLSNYASADSIFSASGDGTHFAEHFLASAAIYTGTYGVMHAGLGCTKLESFILALAVTEVAGFGYKYMEWMQEGYMPPNMVKSMIFNQVGIAVPAIVIWRGNLL